MKPKTIILMVVAVGCGLAASYMTSKLLADRALKEQPVNTVKVLIAKKKVPAYEPIKKPEDYFDEKDVPEGTYPAKCLKSFEEVRGQKLAKAKNEEETVFKEDILTAAQAGVGGNLPDGQRAIAIRVNPEALAGGFVLPGCRVDLIGTMTSPSGELSAETIMQNMLVLAVDMVLNREDRQAMLGSTVTFAATPEEALRLSVATRATDIRLVLRSPADKDKVTLPPSKMLDWRKPASDVRRRVGDTESGDDGSDGGVPGLGKFGKKLDTEVLTVAPQRDDGQQDVVKVETTPQKHVLTITNGEFEQKTIFLKTEGGEWVRKSDQLLDEGPAAPKTAPPVPAPPAPAAPTDEKREPAHNAAKAAQ